MKHRGEAWTDEETQKALALYESGMKIADISSEIERSESAVSKKIKELSGANRRGDWTDEEIKTLTDLFNSGKSYKEIAETLGKTTRACQGKAVRLGLKKKELNVWTEQKRADFWTDTEIEKLNQFVAEGLSASDIAEKIGRSKSSVFYQLGKLNLRIKEKSLLQESNYRRAYTLDDDYFEEIDTQTKAYFLGWLITDGWVTGEIRSKRGIVNSNKIGLKLEISDLDVIEQFKEELKTDATIKHRKARISKEYTNKFTGKKFIVESHEQCSLEVTSAKMKKDLERYGIIPHKTYTVTFPKELKEEFYPGFIAGVMSGDGSVDVKKNHEKGFILRSSICGTQDLLLKIQEILVKNINFNRDKLPRKSSDSEHLYSLEFSQTETIRLYFWLKDSNISLMSRKNRIIEKYLSENQKLLEKLGYKKIRIYANIKRK